MSAPELIEWVPISFGSKPNLYFPMTVAASRNALRMPVAVMWIRLPDLSTKVLMKISGAEHFDLTIRPIKAAVDRTAHH